MVKRNLITALTTKDDYAGETGVFQFDQEFGLSANGVKKFSDHYPVYSDFHVDKDTD